MTFTRTVPALAWAFAAILSVALLGLILTGEAGSPQALPVYGILGVMGGLTATLSRLSARVQAGALSVWLGPGLFRQSYPLTDMAGVNVTQVASPFAVGLRFLPDGWPLGGTDFTEVHLRDGRRLLIGLDEASGLPDTLRRDLRH
ncbi:hypothetical protein GCM10008956_04160 [Deinococcus arenae]|uniref:Uncharacterized protein n=1 Tax=Deinococcus arenae TaxID=1452751 RepID=A0A8H9GM83_9DEIO|nr:hypothetical protein [Deinococcus arenae]AWT35857.1 hypothetical protein DM785_10020 [Deinococcus actinosclerus]GGM31184.1 hypothetical protein GCM10008956_04160 [Deinococcus arenae]